MRRRTNAMNEVGSERNRATPNGRRMVCSWTQRWRVPNNSSAITH